jgi:hypothetical protein
LKKVRGFLSVVETAELLNIFLIIFMALFLNAQGRAEFPVQICLLMNRRAFQTFDNMCLFRRNPLPAWSERALDSGLSATGTVFTGVTTFCEFIMFGFSKE